MSRTLRTAALCVFAALVLTCGCVEWLLPTSLASAAGGWLLRGSLTTPQYACYRNGVPIDCGDVPAEYLAGQP